MSNIGFSGGEIKYLLKPDILAYYFIQWYIKFSLQIIDTSRNLFSLIYLGQFSIIDILLWLSFDTKEINF